MTRPSRTDPYRNFKFRVVLDGRVVAGAAKLGGLKTAAQGLAPVKLERGLTLDAEFAGWIGGEAVARRDLVVELRDARGERARAYRLAGARPSSFVGVPDLDANANALAFDSLVIEVEGWEAEAAEDRPEK